MNTLTARALLFDLDGVLVDSIESVEYAWRQWAISHNLDADAILHVVHGRRAADTVAAVAPHLNLNDEVAALSQSESTESRGLHPIEGASALVSRLGTHQWAVVTSGTRAVATFRLRVGGVPMPDTLIAAEDVSKGKPDPEGYLKAAQLLGFQASECIVVEDAPAGLRAARAAGMQSVGIGSTFDVSELTDATMVVQNLMDIDVRVDAVTGLLHISERQHK